MTAIRTYVIRNSEPMIFYRAVIRNKNMVTHNNMFYDPNTRPHLVINVWYCCFSTVC